MKDEENNNSRIDHMGRLLLINWKGDHKYHIIPNVHSFNEPYNSVGCCFSAFLPFLLSPVHHIVATSQCIYAYTISIGQCFMHRGYLTFVA